MSKGRSSVIRSLLQDRLSFLGLFFIISATIISISGAHIRPDSSKYANDQNIALARKSPGFSTAVLQIPSDEKSRSKSALKGLLFGGIDSSFSEFPYDSLSAETGRVLLFFEGEVLHSVEEEVLVNAFEAEKGVALSELVRSNSVVRKYRLGTDSFGRDMLSRLMAGTIVSLSVGFISVLISLLIGITLGAIAGYYRGYIDNIVMWFINVIWSIPTLLMVIAITLVMGKGFVQVFVAVGLTMWVEVARIVRGQFIALREQPFIEAGRSMGYNPARLIFKHMLPNAIGPVIVISAANFASAILIEAGLSFLGIGTQIPMPSWGTMIKEHYAYITTDMAYLAILPGICITILVLAFMLIGNRLRDILDVRT